MSEVARILDAAANRCREGLRVVEDFARFVLNDAALSGTLKELRHELAAALSQCPTDDWLRSRDTDGDVGRSIQTASEMSRPGVEAVARANCKRVEEALRTLEEFGKTVSVELALRCEQLRYRVYSVERALLTNGSARERLADCRLYLLVTGTALGDELERVVRAALAGGVDAVQLREKALCDRTLLELAQSLQEWTRAAGAVFLINDRPDIAVLADADGVHVGQDDLSVAEARRIVGGRRLVGLSTHSLAQARQGVLEGADYLGVGPVFASQTKEFTQLSGLAFVQEVAREIALPWFAIGGIERENLPQLVAAGGTRIAVSHAVCHAVDPAQAVRDLKRLLPERRRAVMAEDPPGCTRSDASDVATPPS
jgi:thiamine-phosphate pyrophosphorylase